mmetsp:Transcript_26830/g.54931  ORF Transcript_26830/g.54931 Transcript_26830/m.54931 type:complete len:348 (-) Transcript_26830:170-1213(-)
MGADKKPKGKKKKKVGPELNEEEKKALEAKIAASYMDNNMKRKLGRPYKVTFGLVPNSITESLPPFIVRSSTLLFGNPATKALRGMPAAAMRMLRLSPSQVKAIKKSFDSIDMEKTGEISVPEFIYFLEAKDTLFVRLFLNKALLGFSDVNATGVMSFADFTLATCVVCSFSKDQLLYRIFCAYDVDSSGHLDHKEMETLTKSVLDMAGDGKGFNGNLQSFVDSELDKGEDGSIDFDELVAINLNFPLVFYPAFKVQEELRKRTAGGARPWLAAMAKWDAKEKARCKADETRTAQSMADQLEKLGEWYREQKAEHRAASLSAPPAKSGRKQPTGKASKKIQAAPSKN